jgi:uncharacterized RDD family membrane protein YckC
VPESYAGRKAYCLKCQKSVPVPVPARGDSPPEDTTVSLPLQSDDSIPVSAAPVAATALSRTPQADPSAVTVRRAPPPFDPIPPAPVADAKPAKAPSGTHDQAPQYELVTELDGQDHWKVTCFCGKRLLTPTRSENAYGRCPRCGRRIRLPGHDALLKTLDFSIGPAPASGEKPGEQIERKKSATFTKADLDKALELVLAQDDIVTELALLVPEVPLTADPVITATAAMTAADRLRPQRPDSGRDPSGSGSGHIAAWPLAGKIRRGLAGFIDLTFAMGTTALITVLALKGVLPRTWVGWGSVLALFLGSGFFNDGLLHLLLGGSLGKKLVVIVIRQFAGSSMQPGRALLRACCKWLLIPGWFIAAIDPAERSLHDLLCGTLVLRGRPKKRREATAGSAHARGSAND